MRYVVDARRVGATRRSRSRRSCSKASRPTAASRVPRALSALSRRRARRAAAAGAIRDARVRGAVALHRRHSRRPTCARSIDRTYTAATFGSDAITPLTTLEPGLHLLHVSNGPTLAFKDIALQLLGNLFEYVLARRAAHAQHPRRDVRRHRQRRRVRDARQARRRRVHAVAARAG